MVEVLPTLLVHVVGRCGGRPGGRGWRSMRVAAAAGSPHPPLSDRRLVEPVRESLLDSYKNKSHKYPESVLATERK